MIEMIVYEAHGRRGIESRKADTKQLWFLDKL